MINKVFLVGNLGQDPEVKTFDSGSKVAQFSLATSEKYKEETYTEWHSIKVLGKSAEIAEKYLKKGSKVFIEGKIHTEKWNDKEGNPRSKRVINCFSFQFLDSKPESSHSSSNSDLPF